MISAASQSAAVRTLARSPSQVRARIARFEKSVRPRLEVLVSTHAYLRDLLWSFPGVLFALATSNDTTRREAGVALVKAGAPLAAVARFMGVALWMRRLEPEAYSGTILQMPDDAAFKLQIGNHLPAVAGEAAAWLRIVSAAYQAAGDEFAIWSAKRFGDLDLRFGPQAIGALGLYAWFSARRDTLGGSLIVHRFSVDMSVHQVRDHAAGWLEDIQMQLYAPLREARFAHANPATMIDGMTFRRLHSLQELREEGARMNHCLGRYGSELAQGQAMFLSVCEGETPVGTLDVRLGSMGRPHICCLLGKGNAEVPHRVWCASMSWLAGWAAREGDEAVSEDLTETDVRLWLKLWKPYWVAKGRLEDLPFKPGADPLYRSLRLLECCLR